MSAERKDCKMSLKSTSLNMTEGKLFRKILSYTLPIMLSSILQLLFNAADLVIVGHFCGEQSLAAVGATSSLIHLIVNLFIGISVGAGIAVAHSIGSADTEAVRDSVHTAIPLALISSVIITAVGIPLSPVFLSWMQTPSSIIGMASTYMQIYFAGTVFNMLYNFGAAILRANGDTRAPLIYLSVAGIANVCLNVFFVTILNMNVAGVALATVISQAISAVLVIINLMKRTDICRLDIKRMKIKKKALLATAKIGVPTGIQSSLFSISNVLIQASANPFGDIAISGITAAASIESFVYVAITSFTHTVQNFVSQNYGAKKLDRIRNTVFISLGTVTVVGLVLGIGAYMLGTPLLSIYIKDSKEAIEFGLKRLFYISNFYFLCGVMDVLAGAIRGLGVSLAPMAVSLIGACGFRILWIYTIFKIENFHTLECLYLSYPVSWVLTILAHAIVLLIVFKRKSREIANNYLHINENNPTRV